MDSSRFNKFDWIYILSKVPNLILDCRSDKKNKFDLEDIAERGASLILNDFQFDRFDLEDIARKCRRSNNYLHLIDTGNKDKFDLVSLGKKGVFIYSSDKILRDKYDFEDIAKACLSGGTYLTFFDFGRFDKWALRDIRKAGARLQIRSRRDMYDLVYILSQKQS